MKSGLPLKYSVNVWHLIRIELTNVPPLHILDIDECSSSPCKNGGACTDHVNRYRCTCVAGYTDANCNTGTCKDGIL